MKLKRKLNLSLDKFINLSLYNKKLLLHEKILLEKKEIYNHQIFQDFFQR